MKKLRPKGSNLLGNQHDMANAVTGLVMQSATVFDAIQPMPPQLLKSRIAGPHARLVFYPFKLQFFVRGASARYCGT